MTKKIVKNKLEAKQHRSPYDPPSFKVEDLTNQNFAPVQHSNTYIGKNTDDPPK